MHQIIPPRRVRQPLRAAVRRTIEAELRQLPTSELETLRRSLRRQLGEFPVGSPASRLVGRLSRLARSELSRRESADGRSRAKSGGLRCTSHPRPQSRLRSWRPPTCDS
jgi:hypothetical protein